MTQVKKKRKWALYFIQVDKNKERKCPLSSGRKCPLVTQVKKRKCPAPKTRIFDEQFILAPLAQMYDCAKLNCALKFEAKKSKCNQRF
jgi:hypothetical protein